MKNIQGLIMKTLLSSKHPLTMRKLIKDSGIKRKDLFEFNQTLDRLIQKGKVIKTDKGFSPVKASKNTVVGEVIRVHEKFGFVKLIDSEKEVFVPGKYLKGAMPGDKVNVTVSPGRGGLDEGMVTAVTERLPYVFSGTIIKAHNSCQVLADRDFKLPIDIRKSDIKKVENKEKVLCEIYEYGNDHFSHVAKVLKKFGSSSSAANCCEAVLAANSVTRDFPEEVLEQAKEIEEKGIHPKEIAVRKDLRNETIFTIDGADTKDIDDAVSIKKLENGWELGVHIADVSYYVFKDCPIDKEAYKRGTSIYFADSVVPMLPKELSNGICSLNQGEDRLAFSAKIILDENCNIEKYYFDKTIIRSRVKGVYSEINQILAHQEPPEIKEKYKCVEKEIFLMAELANILNKKRIARGAVNLESTESKIILDDKGRAIDVIPRERGISENIIEEFMLCANEAAASFALREELPFVFRVHEGPSDEKIFTLKEILNKLGINTLEIKADCPCSALAAALNKAKGTRYEKLVNNAILRSMSKAKYSDENLGHYGLVLKKYTHFTSPIRRYSDLSIHRIMSGYITGMKRENIEKKYRKFAADAAKQASATEVRAMNIERDCDDCYIAEYMKNHIGEEFDGIISSVTNFGIYVELPNTVEGMCRPEYIENSSFEFDGDMSYRDIISGKTLTVGDNVRIKVLKADVASGNIDFDILF